MLPSRRLSLRLRLTLLYGACFLIAGGAALAITDGLVARDTSSQTRHLQLSGRQVELPWAPLTVRTGAAGASKSNHVTLRIEQIQISPNGTERITWTPSSPTTTRRWFLGHLSDAQLAKLQVGAQEMSACMRAHGLTFPNESVRRGPGGNGFTVGVSSSHVTLPPAEIRSRAFRTAKPPARSGSSDSYRPCPSARTPTGPRPRCRSG